MKSMKKLVRSRRDRMLGGVAAAIGQYLSIDPVVVRVLLVVGLIFTGLFPLALIYALMVAFVPSDDDVHHR
jgi:phage shock protein C